MAKRRKQKTLSLAQIRKLVKLDAKEMRKKLLKHGDWRSFAWMFEKPVPSPRPTVTYVRIRAVEVAGDKCVARYTEELTGKAGRLTFPKSMLGTMHALRESRDVFVLRRGS